jgi:hypothetical protein
MVLIKPRITRVFALWASPRKLAAHGKIRLPSLRVKGMIAALAVGGLPLRIKPDFLFFRYFHFKTASVVPQVERSQSGPYAMYALKWLS